MAQNTYMGEPEMLDPKIEPAKRRYHGEVLDDDGHRFLAVDGLRGYSTVVELSIARGQVISTVNLHTEEARELARHLVEAAEAADRS